MKNEEESHGSVSGENDMITTASSFCYRIIAWIGLYHGAKNCATHSMRSNQPICDRSMCQAWIFIFISIINWFRSPFLSFLPANLCTIDAVKSFDGFRSRDNANCNWIICICFKFVLWKYDKCTNNVNIVLCRMCQSDSPLSFAHFNFESNFSYVDRGKFPLETGSGNIEYFFYFFVVVRNSSRSNGLAAIVIMKIHFSFNFSFRRLLLPFHSGGTQRNEPPYRHTNEKKSFVVRIIYIAYFPFFFFFVVRALLSQ